MNAPPSSRRPSFRAIVFFNLAVLAFLPFGLELVLRWTDPMRGLPIEGYYNDYFYTWGKLVYENRFHFRERDFSETKATNSYRLMLLGDSYTYGVGLTDAERYGNLLEQQLQRYWPDRQVEVLNFGLLGICTTDERDILKLYMDRVQPDRIILGFCNNDPKPGKMEESDRRTAFEQRVPLGILMTNLGSRLNLPRTGEFLKKNFDRLASAMGFFPGWQDVVDATYKPESPEWKAFVQALKEMKGISDQRGLPTPIFISMTDYKNPATASRDKKEYYALSQRWHRQAEAAAREIGWLVLNCENEIPPDAPESWLLVNRFDRHASHALNQIYAQKLFETLTGQLAPAGAFSTVPAPTSPPVAE